MYSRRYHRKYRNGKSLPMVAMIDNNACLQSKLKDLFATSTIMNWKLWPVTEIVEMLGILRVLRDEPQDIVPRVSTDLKDVLSHILPTFLLSISPRNDVYAYQRLNIIYHQWRDYLDLVSRRNPSRKKSLESSAPKRFLRKSQTQKQLCYHITNTKTDCTVEISYCI